MSLDELINTVRSSYERAEAINQHSVEIGALVASGDDSVEFLQMLCRVQEYGLQIKPKNHKYLAIPTSGVKHPSELDGLFFHVASSNAQHPGMATLARSENGQLKVYFLLLPQVNIPARPFMRPAVKQRADDIHEFIRDSVQRIYDGDKAVDYQTIYNHVGKIIAVQVKKNILNMKSPSNAPITVANKGRDDPLIDTGAMLNSISWKVI